MVAIIVVMLLPTVYLLIGIVFTVHFHLKFNHCARMWEWALEQQDQAAMQLYFKAEALAHEDTLQAAVWPLVVKRWTADYLAEARGES